MVIESCLSKTRVWGFNLENEAIARGSSWLSSTSRWACGYRCDGTALVSPVGRFNTVDPLASSASPSNPASWNRYAYVGGDPINHNDPRGLYLDCADGSCDESCDDDSVACSIYEQNSDGDGANAGDSGVTFSVTVDCYDGSGVGCYGSGDGDADDPDDPDDPVWDPEPPSPIAVQTNNCVAGYAGAGAVLGSEILGPIFAGFGGFIGSSGGTLAAPGVGTIGGGILGVEVGATAGTLTGGFLGAGSGWLLGNIFCNFNSGQRKGERGKTARPDGTLNPGKHAKPHPTLPGRWLVKDPGTGKTILKPPGWSPYGPHPG